MTTVPVLLKGFLLGWSVAWPPGPINAEMIRRGLSRGFLPAWAVGLGACCGDFLWALAVSLGAGALIGVPGVRLLLGVASAALLLLLAWTFGRGAWRAWQHGRSPEGTPATLPVAGRFDGVRGGALLGLSLALTSPWNIAFWLAVIGSQDKLGQGGLAGSVALAAAVVLGAVTWGALLCGSASLGARFATPAWHVVTQGATAALMLYFAARVLLRLASGGL